MPAGVAVGLLASPDAVEAEVGARVAEGYGRIKLKIEPGRDIDHLRAARAAGGPGLVLMADANGAYRIDGEPGAPDDARRLDALDDHDLALACLEQPLALDDLLGHAELARRLATPICLDESLTSPAATEQALDLGACSVVCVKAPRYGSWLAAADVLDRCLGNGVDAWVGGMLDTGIGRRANVALAAHPGATLPGDLSATDRFFADDVTPPVVVEGPPGSRHPRRAHRPRARRRRRRRRAGAPHRRPDRGPPLTGTVVGVVRSGGRHPTQGDDTMADSGTDDDRSGRAARDRELLPRLHRGERHGSLARVLHRRCSAWTSCSTSPSKASLDGVGHRARRGQGPDGRRTHRRRGHRAAGPRRPGRPRAAAPESATPTSRSAVDDLDAAYERVQALGQRPQQEPVDIGGVRMFFVADPDGTPIELIELPAGLTSSVELWRGPASG